MSDVEFGDAASVGVLLERHRAALYALAWRILGRGPEVQDAVQDAFLIALSSIDRLREPPPKAAPAPAPAAKAQLPKTGGTGTASMLALGAGALLVAGGLLARRIIR